MIVEIDDRMKGLQLSERLMSKRSDVPILSMCGFTGEIDLDRAEKIGIERVVSKPLSYEQLSVWLDNTI